MMSSSGAATTTTPRRPRLPLRHRPAPPGGVDGRGVVCWELDMAVVRRRYGAPLPPRSAALMHLQAQRARRGVGTGVVFEGEEEEGRRRSSSTAAADAWRRCPEQEKAAWAAKALWDRERHARETAAYLHAQFEARRWHAEQEQAEDGSIILLDLDLGHCRPRAMLEPSSGSEVGGASAPGSGGHAEAKEKDSPLLLPPFASLHACAADGDLAALRRWLLLSQQQQQGQGQGQGQPRQPSSPPPQLDAPFPEGGAWDEAEAPPPVGLTPLALAAACSDHATVDALLAHGCDPRGVNSSSSSSSSIAPSPAHLAALRDPSALLSLLDAGRGGGEEAESLQLLHARDAAGRSLLHYAALGGNAEGVRLLLERGLPPDLRDAAGHTPMDLAAGERVPEIVEIEALLRRARAAALQAGTAATHDAVAAGTAGGSRSTSGGSGNGLEGGRGGLFLKRRKLRLHLEGDGESRWGGLLSVVPSPVAAVGALAAWARGAASSSTSSASSSSPGTPPRSKSDKATTGGATSQPAFPSCPPPSTVVAIHSPPPPLGGASSAWNRGGAEAADAAAQQEEDTTIWCDEAERRERAATRRRLAEERRLAEALLARREEGARGPWAQRPQQDEEGKARFPQSQSQPPSSAAAAAVAPLPWPGGGGPRRDAAPGAVDGHPPACAPTTPLLLRQSLAAGGGGGVGVGSLLLGGQQQQQRQQQQQPGHVDVWDRFVVLWTRRGAAAAMAALLVTCLVALPWWL